MPQKPSVSSWLYCSLIVVVLKNFDLQFNNKCWILFHSAICEFPEMIMFMGTGQVIQREEEL